MRAFLFFFLLTIGLGQASAQCDNINFIDTSLEYAYNKAQKEQKNIFVFVYELGEKKADFFQSGIFYKQEICSVFNQQFINVKAKVNSDLGKAIVHKYHITSFPSFLILSPTGKLLKQTASIRSTNGLKKLATLIE